MRAGESSAADGAEEPDRSQAGPGADADASTREVVPPVGQTDRVAARLSHQEAIDAVYRVIVRSAWAEAAPRLRVAWDEHKASYPERDRASPQTEADGSWTCGEHRRLDPEQNTEASKAHADLADEASRDILPALRRIEVADPDRWLAGLEHMVKSEDRLKEKLADELLGKDKTVRDALNEVADAIRFTLCYELARYADGVLADVNRLKAEGFELIKLKNLWSDGQYKGINSQWRRPDAGTRFEMQFHTAESLCAKELTHQAYERIRKPETTPTERRAAKAFQRAVNAFLPAPEKTERIKDFPEKDL